jgi:hypothetical protein
MAIECVPRSSQGAATHRRRHLQPEPADSNED